MKIIIGDLFKPTSKVDAICITTNGVIRRDGKAVMGAGVAKTARDKYIGIDKKYAELLKKNGNHVQIMFELPEYSVVSFPTKEHWANQSTLILIERSTKELINLTNNLKWKHVWLPRPGCKNGHLNWDDVKPILSNYLDDRFSIIIYKR